MDDSLQSVVDIKRRNYKKILDTLRTCQGSTKKQLARTLSLSFATVSNLCNALEARGLILGEAEDGHTGVGRAPKTICLNDGARLIAAADLHTSGRTALCLYDLRGAVQARCDFEYTAEDIGAFLDEFMRQYNAAFSEEQRRRAAGMGVAVSGIYDTETACVVASELALFEGQPLKELLAKRTGVPVYIENESNLCAFGAAQREKTDNLIYFYIGEGVGIGIWCGGQNVVGQRGYSCEICHAPLGVLNRPCRLCGSRHCLQTDLSIYGFAEKFTGRPQHQGQRADWEAFVAAAQAGDGKALAVADENAGILGAAVSIVVNLFDPAVVSFGGLPPAVYEAMRGPIERTNRSRRVVPGAPETLFLCDADFGETVLQGAAEMAYARWYPLGGVE